MVFTFFFSLHQGGDGVWRRKRRRYSFIKTKAASCLSSLWFFLQFNRRGRAPQRVYEKRIFTRLKQGFEEDETRRRRRRRRAINDRNTVITERERGARGGEV